MCQHSFCAKQNTTDDNNNNNNDEDNDNKVATKPTSKPMIPNN